MGSQLALQLHLWAIVVVAEDNFDWGIYYRHHCRPVVAELEEIVMVKALRRHRIVKVQVPTCGGVVADKKTMNFACRR